MQSLGQDQAARAPWQTQTAQISDLATAIPGTSTRAVTMAPVSRGPSMSPSNLKRLKCSAAVSDPYPDTRGNGPPDTSVQSCACPLFCQMIVFVDQRAPRYNQADFLFPAHLLDSTADPFHFQQPDAVIALEQGAGPDIGSQLVFANANPTSAKVCRFADTRGGVDINGGMAEGA